MPFAVTIREMMMPHGWCLRWNWELLIAHISSDLVMGLGYLFIATMLFLARRKLEDQLGRYVLLSFILFIIGCAMTHLFEIIVVWQPWYRAQACVKILAAALCVATVVHLWRLFVAYR